MRRSIITCIKDKNIACHSHMFVLYSNQSHDRSRGGGGHRIQQREEAVFHILQRILCFTTQLNRSMHPVWVIACILVVILASHSCCFSMEKEPLCQDYWLMVGESTRRSGRDFLLPKNMMDSKERAQQKLEIPGKLYKLSHKQHEAGRGHQH